MLKTATFFLADPLNIDIHEWLKHCLFDNIRTLSKVQSKVSVTNIRKHYHLKLKLIENL